MLKSENAWCINIFDFLLDWCIVSCSCIRECLDQTHEVCFLSDGEYPAPTQLHAVHHGVVEGSSQGRQTRGHGRKGEIFSSFSHHQGSPEYFMISLIHFVLSITTSAPHIPYILNSSLKEEPKRSLAHLCMCYYYISLHNNLEIYAQSA